MMPGAATTTLGWVRTADWCARISRTSTSGRRNWLGRQSIQPDVSRSARPDPDTSPEVQRRRQQRRSRPLDPALGKNTERRAAPTKRRRSGCAPSGWRAAPCSARRRPKGDDVATTDRVENPTDQLRQHLERAGFLLAEFVSIIDSADAADEVAEAPLTNVRPHASPAQQAAGGPLQVVQPPAGDAGQPVELGLASPELLELPAVP